MRLRNKREERRHRNRERVRREWRARRKNSVRFAGNFKGSKRFDDGQGSPRLRNSREDTQTELLQRIARQYRIPLHGLPDRKPTMPQHEKLKPWRTLLRGIPEMPPTMMQCGKREPRRTLLRWSHKPLTLRKFRRPLLYSILRREEQRDPDPICRTAARRLFRGDGVE